MLNLIGSLLGGKGGALKTIAKVVDEIHTSEDDRDWETINKTIIATIAALIQSFIFQSDHSFKCDHKSLSKFI